MRDPPYYTPPILGRARATSATAVGASLTRASGAVLRDEPVRGLEEMVEARAAGLADIPLAVRAVRGEVGARRRVADQQRAGDHVVVEPARRGARVIAGQGAAQRDVHAAANG